MHGQELTESGPVVSVTEMTEAGSNPRPGGGLAVEGGRGLPTLGSGSAPGDAVASGASLEDTTYNPVELAGLLHLVA